MLLQYTSHAQHLKGMFSMFCKRPSLPAPVFNQLKQLKLLRPLRGKGKSRTEQKARFGKDVQSGSVQSPMVLATTTSAPHHPPPPPPPPPPSKLKRDFSSKIRSPSLNFKPTPKIFCGLVNCRSVRINHPTYQI